MRWPCRPSSSRTRGREPQVALELLDELEALPQDAEEEAAAGDGGKPSGDSSAVDPLTFAYSATIRAHEVTGDWKGALSLFDRLIQSGVQPDAHSYCAALGACRRGGQADRALGLIVAARDDGKVQMNGVMYNLAMAACNSGKQWEASLTLFDARKTNKAMEKGNAEADAYAYSIALGACAQGKQWERALSLLEEMEGQDGCKGNAYAWNHAMVACNKGGQPEKALELYDQMRAGACALSEHSVAAALGACRELSAEPEVDGGRKEERPADWQRAQAIFDGHREQITLQSEMCHCALFDVLSEAGEWSLLLRYFDDMKRRKMRPPSHAYEKAIEACDRVDPDRSMVLFTEMRASS